MFPESALGPSALQGWEPAVERVVRGAMERGTGHHFSGKLPNSTCPPLCNPVRNHHPALRALAVQEQELLVPQVLQELVVLGLELRALVVQEQAPSVLAVAVRALAVQEQAPSVLAVQEQELQALVGTHSPHPHWNPLEHSPQHTNMQSISTPEKARPQGPTDNPDTLHKRHGK